MLDEIESKTVHKDEGGDRQKRRRKTVSEVKSVEKIRKNFLEINPVQNELVPSHKLKDYTYE